jgi:hypothetical protein
LSPRRTGTSRFRTQHASLGLRRNGGLFGPSSDCIKLIHLPKIHHDQIPAEIAGSGTGKRDKVKQMRAPVKKGSVRAFEDRP